MPDRVSLVRIPHPIDPKLRFIVLSGGRRASRQLPKGQVCLDLCPLTLRMW
jgi:hypothetical protein